MFVFGNRFIYSNLYILYNNYYIFIDYSFLNLFYKGFLSNIYCINLKKLNYFSERKTNLGLFYLLTNLVILVFLSSNIKSINSMFLKNTKYILSKNKW